MDIVEVEGGISVDLGDVGETITPEGRTSHVDRSRACALPSDDARPLILVRSMNSRRLGQLLRLGRIGGSYLIVHQRLSATATTVASFMS